MRVSAFRGSQSTVYCPELSRIEPVWNDVKHHHMQKRSCDRVAGQRHNVDLTLSQKAQQLKLAYTKSANLLRLATYRLREGRYQGGRGRLAISNHLHTTPWMSSCLYPIKDTFFITSFYSVPGRRAVPKNGFSERLRPI